MHQQPVAVLALVLLALGGCGSTPTFADLRAEAEALLGEPGHVHQEPGVAQLLFISERSVADTAEALDDTIQAMGYERVKVEGDTSFAAVGSGGPVTWVPISAGDEAQAGRGGVIMLMGRRTRVQGGETVGMLMLQMADNQLLGDPEAMPPTH